LSKKFGAVSVFTHVTPHSGGSMLHFSLRERIFVELMASNRRLTASREDWT